VSQPGRKEGRERLHLCMMKRHLFNILAGLSLLLCLATVALWVRSYWTTDSVGRFFRWETKPAQAGGVAQTRQWQGIGVEIESYPSRLMMTLSYGPSITDASGRPIAYVPHVGDNSPSFTWTHAPVATRVFPWPSVAKWRGVFSRQFFLSSSSGLFTSSYVMNRFGVFDWLIVLATGILPTIQIILWLKPKRPGPGFCQQCGYDLRATPDRCPECGTVPTKKETNPT